MLLGWGDDHHLVLGCVEPYVRPRDVVDHHGVERLLLELAPCVAHRVCAVLGREPDQHLARAALAAQGGQHILG